MVFNRYAAFYDALYQDKDYEAECDFLQQVFTELAQGPVHTILDLGCGTGGHALPLARRGYSVTGIDRSEGMLWEARRKAAAEPSQSGNCEFAHGDIRELDLNRAYDVVISMFAVMSYHTTNQDLDAAFKCARRHLDMGGLYIFDAWFGPATIHEPPTDRFKIIEGDGERVIRFAHPEVDVESQVVTVGYSVLRLKDGRVLEEVSEIHHMRPLYVQEVSLFALHNGFCLLKASPFMDLKSKLTVGDWNVSFVALAV